MTIWVDPKIIQRFEDAAEENLAAGGWVAPDPAEEIANAPTQLLQEDWAKFDLDRKLHDDDFTTLLRTDKRTLDPDSGLQGLIAEHPDYGEVGRVQYYEPNELTDDKLHVHYVNVEPRYAKHGVASWLMNQIERQHPGVIFDHGDRTAEGKRWARAYYGSDSRFTLDGKALEEDWREFDEERKLHELPRRPWHEPPVPWGHPGRKAGGYTAVGIKDTAFGDAVEQALQDHMGMVNEHPGRRQGPLDLRYGQHGYELKAVTQAAEEYKSKPKKAEVESKRAYAEEHHLQPHTMIAVYAPGERRVHVYSKPGIGAYRLTDEAHGWSYHGSAPLDLGDTTDPAATLGDPDQEARNEAE
jgi:GNAT superfamily N-acetyltransferase